ncbi:amidohydrolase family protein [Rhodococcus sp. P1Y]|uniref:amidohydrolase family protein n=1 Tax=Rhodococcus sp. P1Y TaxID=1302308 RepID=UPI000EB5A45E|nr:amidohydrolase family protein [Rhodococcus sp. P1Y]AYJ47782.1 amidohydrolase [Rhodococcus sp. P1Y]
MTIPLTVEVPSGTPRGSVVAETEQVRSFWQELGLPGVFDVHTHFMPKNVMDKVWAYFDQVGSAQNPVTPQAPLLPTGMAWPITYREDEDARLNTLRGFGVRGFTSMIYPHKPSMAAWLNSWGADFASRTPDCLHTATFYPEESAAEYVADAISAGTRIFKSHIQVGSYSPNDALLEPVWGAIEDASIPVVIHCGSGPTPGPHTGPGPIGELLGRFPRLPLIIAHMGMPEYSEFLDLAERYEHVRLDTTMAFTDFSEARWPFPSSEMSRLRDLQGRILFGSDFPNIPYTYAEALEAVARLDLGDDWVRDVCYSNGAELFTLA